MDKVEVGFLKRFAIVIVALHALVGLFALIAGALHADQPTDPRMLAALESRIMPIGRVVTDPSQLIVKTTATRERTPLTAAQLLDQCGTCHQTGVLGAPKVGDHAAWATRLERAGDLTGLVESAIQGRNAMPPRGGFSDLSNEEIETAVRAMLQQSGVSL